MSKSELKSLGPTVHITRKIERELKKNLDQLKEVLKDNPEFANLLVKKMLLLGKEVYINEIQDLLFIEYPPIDNMDDKDYHNNYQIRRQLLKITFDIATLMEGDPLTRKKIVQLPEDQQEQYIDILHNEVEKEIREIFFSSKNSNMDIMGESNDFET